MNNVLKLLVGASVILLSGCVGLGPQASWGEKMQDNFFFTSADSASSAEVRCITLTKPFYFQSGSVGYTLPAGTYKGTKKNKTGYFYYAPSEMTSSSWLYGAGQGIYINNQFNGGNLFGVNPSGFDARPIRFTILPNTIFSYIKNNGRC